MERINTITEQVLYCIIDSDVDLKTRDICNKLEYRDTLVKSQLQQLRDRGLVTVDKVNEYGGNAKATNFYQATDLARRYDKLYGLSIPKYILREDFDELRDDYYEWKEYDKQWKEAMEEAVGDLEESVDELS